MRIISRTARRATDSVTGALVALLIVAFTVGPFITHIVWCIGKAAETGSAIALLIVGVVMPPVGWAHGLCLWFGFTWI